MSNTYCTTAQLDLLYDARVTAQLSNDASSVTVVSATVQFHLDVAASKLDSILAGRVSTVPIASPPAFFTKFVAAWAMRSMYGRRSDLPAEVKADAEEADAWLENFIKGIVSIPGTTRAQPELTSSGSTDGTSRFDNIPYFSPRPTATSTSKGTPWSGGL